MRHGSGAAVLAGATALLAGATAGAQSPGPYRPDRAAEVIRQGLPSIRRCYERELRRDPALVATPSLRLRIEPTGRVSRVWVQMNPPHAELTACITAAIMRLVFDPHAGGPVELSYGFNSDPAQ